MKSSFGPTLKRLRNERQLSVRALASLARVSVPWITLVENGHRSIGRNSLEKLGAALELSRAAMDEFILLGVTAGRVEPGRRSPIRHHPRLHAALGLFLREAGIQPCDIREVEVVSEFQANEPRKLATGLQQAARSRGQEIIAATGTALNRPALRMRLRNHQALYIEFLLIKADGSASPGAALAAARNPPLTAARAPQNRPAKEARPHGTDQDQTR
jgi:transcriptional regulator with XRE-family HTH domain